MHLKRRSFLKLLGLAFVAPKAAIEAFEGAEKAIPITDYTHKTYSLGFTMTHEAAEEAARQLGIPCRQTLEREAASVFNNAFSAHYTRLN